MINLCSRLGYTFIIFGVYMYIHMFSNTCMLHLMLHQAPVVDEVFRSFTEVKVVKPQCKNTKKYYLKNILKVSKVKLLRIV